MQSIDKQIFNRLTKLYLMALLAVGILSLGGQLVIQLFLKDILDDSHIVNIAGRQRMLSQKIAKSVLLLNKGLQENLHVDLNEDLESWAKNHRGLKNGQLISEKRIFFKNSDKIDSLFEQLEPVFTEIYKNTNNVINKKLDTNRFASAKREILENEPKFLKTMIEIVAQYDKEAAKRVNKMRKIESLLFSLLMLVLVLEGFFIFKPIANNIRIVISQLTNSESQLKNVNSHLQKSNIDLSVAKKALFKATEEKYKLQISEEKTRASALIEGQEAERKRLALELHDGIGQMLTGLRLQAEHLKSFKFVSEKQAQSFKDLQNLIGQTIVSTRAVSFNLAPAVLSDFGLIPALNLLAEQYNKAGSIPLEINETLKKRVPENVEIGLYRIVQEAVNNAQKHSKASLIKLNIYQKGKELTVEIADNGIGFDLNKKKITNDNKLGGTGLNNMQTRINLLNGSFSIKSELAKGTIITVQLST